MSGHRNREPSNAFCEIVQVGRNFVDHPDVTVFYESTGHGVFDVDGGVIFRQSSEAGRRRLTVVTNSGHVFDITRQNRGAYRLNTAGYWMTGPERIFP